MPTLHKSEEVGQGSSKGFTYTEEISYIGRDANNCGRQLDNSELTA